jgi:hypothetical protein
MTCKATKACNDSDSQTAVSSLSKNFLSQILQYNIDVNIDACQLSNDLGNVNRNVNQYHANIRLHARAVKAVIADPPLRREAAMNQWLRYDAYVVVNAQL